jgi:DNA-binding SARP family transcriptional activator
MTLQLRLFGYFQVTEGDTALTQRLRPRAQRLLAYLLLHRHRSLIRENAAFTLWPDQPEKDALGALRRALSDLRATLPGDQEWITATRSDLRWNLSAPYWLDVEAYGRLNAQNAPATLHDAIALYTGDLLAGWDDEWLLVERERLRQAQLDALRRLAIYHRALDEYDTALRLSRQALSMDPLSEAASRIVIALHYEAGDRAAALAAYNRLRRTLKEELDAEPMPETQALADAIMRGAALPDPDRLAPPVLPSRTAAPLPTLIGRHDEMSQLDALRESAASGQGRLVIISGEAGVGKSHLALALADAVIRHNGMALTGYCFEFEQALPYQAITEMLRSASNLIQHVDLPAVHRAVLAHLVPDVLGTAGSLLASGPPADLRDQLFEALVQAFLALARSQPLLLLFEDVHWAAESTLDWLMYIAPRLPSSRLLVAITYRMDEVGAQHALVRLEHRFARGGVVSVLPLKPLSREAFRELVSQISGLEEPVALPVADRLFAETAGNPFFLQEIVRSLVEGGSIIASPGRWSGPFVDGASQVDVPLPESVRATIGTRVERLSEMARTFLQAAAVAGRVFQFDIVQRAGEWGDELALGALESLLSRKFVRESQTGGAFVFAHHLVQEAIYADMSAPRRAFWHRRLAEAIQALRAKDYAALVHHWGLSGDASKEGEYAALAGEQAAAVFANDEAIRYFERARELLRDPEERIQVMGRLGEVWVVIGQWQSAESVYHQALSFAGEIGNRKLQAHFQRLLGELMSRKGLFAPALDWLAKARENSEAIGDRSGLAHIITALGIVHTQLNAFDDALNCFEQALQIVTELGDRAGIAIRLGNIAIVHNGQGVYVKALEYHERALQIYRELGNKQLIGISLGNIGNVYRSLGNYPRALSCHQEALTLRQELSDKAGIAVALGNIGQDDEELGAFEAALACYLSALHINLALDRREGVAQQTINVGGVLRELDRLNLAFDWLDRGIALARRLGSPYYLCAGLIAQAKTLLAQQQIARAQTLNDEALRVVVGINAELEFEACLLAIRMQVASNTLSVPEAIDALAAARARWPEPRRQAAIHYEAWRLDRSRQLEGQAAAALYQRLWDESPRFEYRRRYEEVTGESISGLPFLPELPDIVQQNPADPDVLLVQLDKLLIDIQSEH